jgi:hypothetical protein
MATTRGKRTASRSRTASRPSVAEALSDVAKRMPAAKSLRKGTIVVRATGAGGGEFRFDTTAKTAKLVTGARASTEEPTLEIVGDARRIQAALSGDKDVRALYLGGGLRLRGDLNYFSELAQELGIIDEPL